MLLTVLISVSLWMESLSEAETTNVYPCGNGNGQVEMRIKPYKTDHWIKLINPIKLFFPFKNVRHSVHVRSEGVSVRSTGWD